GVNARIGLQRSVTAAVNVIGAVDCPIIGGCASPIYGEGNSVRGSTGTSVANEKLIGGIARHAGHEDHQLLVVTRAKAKLGDLPSFDGGRTGWSAEFNQSRIGGYFDDVARRANLQTNVDAQIVGYIQDNFGALLGLEANCFDFNRIKANRNI